MKVEIQIDADCREPVILVKTDRITPEIQELARRLSSDAPRVLVGQRDGEWRMLDQADILRVYGQDGRVLAVTGEGEFALRQRLYQLEEWLDGKSFVRISNSEIINLKWVKGFDLSFAGTICVTLADGSASYVSRRYLPRIKRILGL